MVPVTLVVLLLAPSASAESAVKIGELVKIGGGDVGLEGAVISPDGEIVIAYGADSSIFLIEAPNPENNSKLEWNGSERLLDADFHPGGQTSLIVGELGKVIRFIRAENSVESAGGEMHFGQTELRAISWNDDGSWAYIGGEMGWIWRARWLEGGGMEAHAVEGRGTSDVNGISCVGGTGSCVISTSVDGIGVIDSDHEVHWIGGTGYPWIDVACPGGVENDCVAISSDKNIAIVRVDAFDASASDIGIVQLQDLEGRFNGIEMQSDGKSLITMAPFAIIEHDLSPRMSFPWLENADAVNFDPSIAGERIVATWPTDESTGWLLTGPGHIVEFGPADDDGTNGLLGIWIGVVVLGGVTLLVASLVVSSSPSMSRWLAIKIGSEEERFRAERELRRLGRKK
tara:strand:- start:2160 stop:3359 length:1200 start_codon:yes stop_codon:yes gene_type:complete